MVLLLTTGVSLKRSFCILLFEVLNVSKEKREREKNDSLKECCLLNSGLDLFEWYAYSFAVILAACSHKLYCYEKKNVR